jgi:hypothetical protein
MSSEGDTCRRKAAEAKERAAQATNPSIKSAFEDVAAEWVKLAEEVERMDRDLFDQEK